MTVTNYAEWKAAVASEHKKLFEVCKEQGIIEDYDQDEIDTMFSRLEREEDDDDEDR